ncbi:hypothetical protein E3J62_11025 [candidate division TA06 bacterium]|uniref:Uncharacterized protein n=1 Tax=candidate division TA06 bacterium TaxID=2250710 RepID=A0A523UNR6_UNCT6|nr:MAG: hypothetical protein E3J62_11025 [candidate division TA06 bacterium]
MDSEVIKARVEEAIDELEEQFEKDGTLFYTENDVVCRFYALIQEGLEWATKPDRHGQRHYLVHREYPTPFRCDMGGVGFAVKGEGDRTSKGGKYQRGHYDIVVLNPEFIQAVGYRLAKGQDFELVTENFRRAPSPAVLYGLEFMFNRDPPMESRGENRDRSIDTFCKKVFQDHKKLEESKRLPDGHPFMAKTMMLVFDNACSEKIRERLKDKLNEKTDLRLCLSERVVKT